MHQDTILKLLLIFYNVIDTFDFDDSESFVRKFPVDVKRELRNCTPAAIYQWPL